MPSVDITAANDATLAEPPLPMKRALRTIRSYILWQHERGTLHYDIMVTLILIFVFLSPRVINFNDKPGTTEAHPTGVVVSSDSAGELVFQIEAGNIAAGDDTAVRAEMQRVIEPISGDVSILKYEAVSDGKGRVQEYRVWAKRKP